MDTYIIKKTSINNIWDIAKFSGNKDADSIYKVNKRGQSYYCDCPGYWRQKEKSDHKHCKLVKFWKEELEELYGIAIWLDNNEIEYNQFIT